MVNTVKVQKQLSSFYRRFKIHARHGFGLVSHVGAITTFGRLASPRWLPHAHTHAQHGDVERPSVVTAPMRPTSPIPSRARTLKRSKQLNGCFRSQTIFMLKMAYETTKSSYNTILPLHPISQNNLLNIAMSSYWQTWKFSKFLSWTWFQFTISRLVEILASNIIFNSKYFTVIYKVCTSNFI